MINEIKINETEEMIELLFGSDAKVPCKEQKDGLTFMEWKNEVAEHAINGRYLGPFPKEMRREFWKHNLNPITGMTKSSVIYGLSINYESVK